MLPGVMILRRDRRRKPRLAIAAVLLGILILLAGFWPESFWWLVTAVGLISFGLWRLICRK